MSYTNNKYFATFAGPWAGDTRPQLFYVKKQITDSRRTEVHILSAASGYKEYILHTATGLHPTHENFVFKLADWDGDGIPDLWAIKKWNPIRTGSGKTEVHIFSGASSFAQPIFHGATALHETGANFDFDILPRGASHPPDLVAIKRSGTGTSSTEVHILSGASEFKDFNLQTPTGLHETGTGDKWAFAMADLKGDGVPDLVAITSANGGELHSLQGPDYREFNRQIPFNENNASQVVDTPGFDLALLGSCATAALKIFRYWLVGPMSAPLIAVTWGETYVSAVTCYTMVKNKYMRVADQPSGRGRSGDDSVREFREFPDRPPPPSEPGPVQAPPPPDDPPPPSWESDPAERPFEPAPPPGPRGPDPFIGV